MDKQQIQQRVLQNDKLLDLEKFSWDEVTKTFLSKEIYLYIDFENIDNCNIIAGDSTTLTAGDYSILTAGRESILTAGDYSTLTAGDFPALTAGRGSILIAGRESILTAGDYSTLTANDDDSTLIAGNCSNLTACNYSTLTAGDGSNLIAGHYSTLTAGDRCNLIAGIGSILTAGNCCNITADYGSTIYAKGNNIAIINKNVFEVIIAKKGDVIQTTLSGIKGYIKNGIYSETGKKAIIADNIFSEIISKKGEIYKVINYGESESSYLVEREVNGEKVYAHGKTIKEARESLIYKLVDRDTSKYEDLTLDSVLTREEAIQCYMAITGACSYGTKSFVDRLNDDRNELLVKEIIELTKGQYGNEEFRKFFKKPID